MPVAGSSVTLVRNTLANGAGGAIGTLLGLLVTPFTIAQLGLPAYGVWTLALTLSFAGGYAAMTDLGLEAATVRYVAEAVGDDDRPAINRTVATTLVFFTAVGAVIAIVTVALASLLTSLFNVSEALRGAATIAFVLVGGQVVLEMPSRAFVAVLKGTQRFVAFQAVELVRALAFAVSTVLVLLAGWGIVGLAAAFAGTGALTFACYWLLAHRAVHGLRVGPHHASRGEFRRLMSYGSGVFALRLLGTAYRQLDKLILGVATTPAIVGLYEVANKLQLGAQLVQTTSVSAVSPAAAQSRRDPALLRDMLLRGSSYTVAMSMPAMLGALVFAEPLIRDWIGPAGVPATTAAQLFLAWLALTVFVNVPITMLVAIGRLRGQLLIVTAMTVVNVVVSITLVGPLGLEGVVLGTVVAAVLGIGPQLALCLRTFEVPLRQWTRRVVLPHLLPALLQTAALLLGLRLLGDVGSLALDGLWILATMALSYAVFARFGLGAEERRVLFATLRRAVGRADAAAPGPTVPLATVAAEEPRAEHAAR